MQRFTDRHELLMFVLFLMVLLPIMFLDRQGYTGRNESTDVAEAGRASASIEYSTTFAGQTMRVDGRAFHECTFRDCVLIYSGGRPPSLVGCTLERVAWKFKGAARDTLCFIRLLHEDMYRGGHGPMESGFKWLQLLSNPNQSDAQPAPGEDAYRLAAEGGSRVEQ